MTNSTGAATRTGGLDSAAVKTAYRRWAGFYDTAFGLISGAGRRRAVALANRLPGEKVLEVGVGTGLALPHYAAGKTVIGVDLSREMLLKAQERVARERLTHVLGLFEMDAQATAFADSSFDMAVAMFTASVVPDAKALFAEMNRVVRPGGYLIFVNHFLAEGGPRLWVERAMAPAGRILGWHPDFARADLVDTAVAQPEIVEACPPVGLFTLLAYRRPDAT
jgi:phosphatidylethanolamine/phosphatidyl-N-methylethanolamine N-methyltransferase